MSEAKWQFNYKELSDEDRRFMDELMIVDTENAIGFRCDIENPVQGSITVEVDE